jgi:hypothetical protein
MLDVVSDNRQEFVPRRRYLVKWVAILVRQLAEASSYDDVQAALDSWSYAKRIEVLWKLKNEKPFLEAAGSLRDKLVDQESERAATLVLEHLAAGDAADLDVPT